MTTTTTIELEGLGIAYLKASLSCLTVSIHDVSLIRWESCSPYLWESPYSVYFKFDGNMQTSGGVA